MKKIERMKPGPKTDNPKIRRVQAKLDEDTSAILDRYCNQENITESEGVRRGIKKLSSDLKKEE